MKTRDYLIIGGLAALAIWYFTGRVKAATKAIIALPGQAGSAIGISLYDWTHPGTVGETLYYTVTFPDGQRHAVPSLSVSAGGLFKLPQFYYDMQFQMKRDAAGNNVAIPA